MNKKAKIKVDFEDFYKGFMETIRRKDLKRIDEWVIEGEIVEEKPKYIYKVGDFVRVVKFEDVFGNERRVGRVIYVDEKNIKSGCYGICFSRKVNSTRDTPYNEDDLEPALVNETEFFNDFGIYSEIKK